MEISYSTVSERPVQLWISASLLEDRLDAEFYQPIYLRALDSVRSTGFPTRPLVEVCVDKFRVYWGIKGLDNPPSATHIPYIRPNEVADDGWIEYDNLTTIERHWVDDLPGAVVRPGDLLVEVKGNARKVHIVRDDVPPFTFVSGSMYRFVPSDEVDVQYLWTYLTSQTCQTIKARLMSNSIIKWINPEDICQLPVPLPPKPVQEYIGAKVRLAERCRTRARELYAEVQRTLDQIYKGAPTELTQTLDFWVEPAEFDSPRLDSWHYQPVYRRLVQWCRECEFVPASSIASLAQRKWSPKQTRQLAFHYIEISDIEVSTGHVSGKELSTAEAPGRARKLVRAYDVLVSTVRPNRKGVGIVPPGMDGWVASTGFSVLQATNSLQAYFLCAVLRHDVSTLQMMRWNTGATYPAIDEDVPLRVLVPSLDAQLHDKIGKDFGCSIQLLNHAICLVHEAKADVEALIEGRLDVEGIVAGRVQPPRWEDLEV